MSESTSPVRSPAAIPWIAFCGLGLFAVIYSSVGFFGLVVDNNYSYPIDLRLRWMEEKLVYGGLNPQVYGHPGPELPKVAESMRHLGGSYPPWTYALNMVLVPPLSWTATRCYFATLCLAAVGVIGWSAYAYGRHFEGMWPWVFVAALLAAFPIAVCISYGQAAVLIAALLLGCCLLIENRRPWLGGVCLALALVKPQLAMLCAIPPILRKEFRPIIVAGLITLISSYAVAWTFGVDPWSMLRTATGEARHYTFLSHNPLIVIAQQRLGFGVGTMVAMLAGAAAALVLCLLLRADRSLLHSFAVCVLVSMFWSYRRNYDAALLVIPLLSMLMLTVSTRSVVVGVVCLALGLSLWLPLRIGQWDMPLVQWAAVFIWAVALFCIVWQRRRGIVETSARDRIAASSVALLKS